MLRPLFLSLFCTFAAFSLGAEEGLFLGVERTRIERVIELGYNMDASVEEEIAKLRKEHPESPVGPMMEAGVLYWRQKWAEWDEGLQARFEERSEAALAFAKDFLRKNEDDPDARFSVALIELMQVIYYVDHRRWWAAFWKSGSSLKTMRKLVAKHPDYHDAKFPLGMQNCYLSKTPGYLKPLAFLMRFKGDWDVGIRFLKESRDGGLFCRVDAGYHLSAIRFELEGDREAARDEMARLVERYPGNLEFRALLAELTRGLGRQDEAREAALAALSDERLGAFAALRGRLLTTLLWSSLASGRFELAIQTAAEQEAFLEVYPQGAGSPEWAAFVRAEASLGLGERQRALEIWGTVVEGADAAAAAAARKRLSEELAVSAES